MKTMNNRNKMARQATHKYRKEDFTKK